MQSFMKSSLLFIVLLATISIAKAQGLNYGVIGGMTAATVIEKSTIESDVQKSLKYGYQFGIAAEFELYKMIFISTSITYITKGDKYKDRFAVSKASFGSFEIPVYIGYKIPLGNVYLSGNVGPYSSLSVVGKRTFTEVPEVIPPFEWNFEASPHQQYIDNNTSFYGEEWNSYRRFDTGISFGLRAGYKNYNIAASYSRSFIDIRPNETIKATNSVLSFSFIYLLTY
jgi:hypothetical protein